MVGEWKDNDVSVHLDHAQADPYAAPSRARVQMSAAKAGFPPELYSTPSRVSLYFL